MAKINLKVKVNDFRFQYQPRVSRDACLLKELTIRGVARLRAARGATGDHGSWRKNVVNFRSTTII